MQLTDHAIWAATAHATASPARDDQDMEGVGHLVGPFCFAHSKESRVTFLAFFANIVKQPHI